MNSQESLLFSSRMRMFLECLYINNNTSGIIRKIYMTLSDIPTVIYYNPSGEILAWVLGTSPSWVIDTESHGLATVAQRCTYFEFAEEKDSQSPLRSCLNSLKMETVRPDAALRRRRGKSRNHHTQTRDGYDMLKVHQTSRKKCIEWANGGRGSENIFVTQYPFESIRYLI